jgi:hypothetical protein
MRVVHGGRGFCAVNIEAIMIEYLRQAYKVDKVAIVDTDCHHGDGTQDIYWHDPDTLFISIHQDGRTLYPGSGSTSEMGGAAATGTTLNIPLPPKTSEEGFLYAVKNIVLPVLEEFKPDLIVNSAGQDNHYSDPITDMNFSARGYADLTAMLKPDIAVLEGGYSIEGALPYMNLGIILAMAGLDYSHVKEPDYDPDRIRQSADVTEYIEQVGETVMNIWQQRDNLRDMACDNREYIIRDRNIFYDTDQIMEKQKDRIRVCPDCSGVLHIDSSSGASNRIMAIHIPRKACNKCRELGYQWYETAGENAYDRVYLQDRVEDKFIEDKLKPGIGEHY